MSNTESGMTDKERADLERFRACVREDVGRSHAPGYSTDRLASLGSAVCIAARHFASGSVENPEPSLEYRKQLLSIAAELTGIPLEPLTLADGTVAQAWRPARGEVGWLPYEESGVLWGMKDVRDLFRHGSPASRYAVLTGLLKDVRWAHPTREGETVYDTATGEACTVGAWWPYHPTTGADGEHVMVTWKTGPNSERNSEILPMPERYTWEKPSQPGAEPAQP